MLYDFAGTAQAHAAPLSLVGRPYALWAHGWEVWPGNLRPDYAKVLRGAKAVFVNSNHTGERLLQSLPGLRTIQRCVLGTEWDIEPPRLRVRSAAVWRENLVLFVGRNDDMFAKGQDVLIAAWPAVVAQIPDAVLCFVGGGELARSGCAHWRRPRPRRRRSRCWGSSARTRWPRCTGARDCSRC